VGAVDDTLTIGDIVDFMHEDSALFSQLIHNIAVVNDFTANIDRSAEGFEGDFDDVDGANDSSTKAARL
jgi:hypothetical protein